LKKKSESEKNVLDASSIVENGFYVGWHNKTQLYHRVQVKQKFGTDYLIYFIDYGDNEVVPLSYLQPLPYDCCHLPAQAVKAQLAGKAFKTLRHFKDRYIDDHVITINIAICNKCSFYLPL